jgi:hypothetical protein
MPCGFASEFQKNSMTQLACLTVAENVDDLDGDGVSAGLVVGREAR